MKEEEEIFSFSNIFLKYNQVIAWKTIKTVKSEEVLIKEEVKSEIKPLKTKTLKEHRVSWSEVIKLN